MYPSILCLSENQDNQELVLPRLHACSAQDLEVGTFLIDQGHTIYFVEFYKDCGEEEQDFEKKADDDSRLSDGKESKVLVYKFVNFEDLSTNEKMLAAEYFRHEYSAENATAKLDLSSPQMHHVSFPRFFNPNELK